MEKKFRIWNLIGGIILLLCPVGLIIVLINVLNNQVAQNVLDYSRFAQIDYSAIGMFSLFYLLPVVIAGVLLIIDFVKNYAADKKSKLPAIATVIAFATIIPPGFFCLQMWLLIAANVKSAILESAVEFQMSSAVIAGGIILLAAIIAVIGLCAINKKSIVEFLKNKQRGASKKPSGITKFFQCIGGGFLSYMFILPMMPIMIGIQALEQQIVIWIILVLAAVCFITIKIRSGKSVNIVKLCILYLLVLFETTLLVASKGEFFMEDGVGWMVLKVACAVFVLLFQFLCIKSCFKYLNKKNGAFTASLIIGAAAIVTSVIAIVVAVYAIIIAVVLIVGYVILVITGYAGGSGRRGKRGISVTHADGTVEEFEESGINLMGETTYRNKYGGEAYSRDEIKRGDASRN